MLYNIKVWWKTERINRFEKGTSQDVCPTNGGAVLWIIFNCIIGGVFLILIHFFK